MHCLPKTKQKTVNERNFKQRFLCFFFASRTIVDAVFNKKDLVKEKFR